jgi:hypothetical protein
MMPSLQILMFQTFENTIVALDFAGEQLVIILFSI